MEWKQAHGKGGDWFSADGHWKIRGPIMGKKMFWLYHNSGRFNLTGSYEDSLSFPSVKKAKAFVDAILNEKGV